MLSDSPVQWSSAEVRQALGTLETIYRKDEIVAIVHSADLPIAMVQLDGSPRLVWRSVFQVAAGYGKVDQLLDTVVLYHPELAIPLGGLRTAVPVLDSEVPVPPEQRDAVAPAWKNFSTDGQAEAIIIAGQPTFVDIAFLTLGMMRARAVCRMVTRFPAGLGSGTGFRVGQHHLLTNYHVVHDSADGDARATAVEAWFNYEDDVDGTAKKITQIRCDPSTIVAEKPDDWALITAAEPIPDGFPALALGGGRIPAVDDRVYIIQHPGGRPKQVAFSHNLVRAILPDVLQYWTDTDLGSSGAPVFDERWNVVALHHFSVKAPAGERVGVRNQGRRIDRVVGRIRARAALPELVA